MTSITIPNSVTSIGSAAFMDCTGLTSVSIPNSMTSIGSSAFQGCISLTYVNIPKSITIINECTFMGCSGLVSLKLPEGLKIIKSQAFSDCWNLESLTIPSTVEFIYQEAFANCSVLSVINALPATPPFIYINTFSNFNVPLKVPAESVGTYRTHNVWKNFKNIKTIDGSEFPDPEKCATPTISYSNGELSFDCKTEGVEFVYEITDDDIKKGYTAKVKLTATYTITVYATKAGYENSEVATATLCWIDVEPQTEGIEDAVAEVKALPVLIQSHGGTISIQGAKDGTEISVFSVNGMKQASATSCNGGATLNTSLLPGSVAIVKIGEKTVKVAIK